jgi:hypothetical protein
MSLFPEGAPDDLELYAARTLARNRLTSLRSISDWRDSSEAEVRTWLDAVLESSAARVTLPMLDVTCCVPAEA